MVASEAVLDEAFVRLSQGRQELGLNNFQRAIEGDNSFVPVFEWIIGCYETTQQHEDLQRPDIDAIGLMPIPAGSSECGMTVTTYHYVPDSEKLRVESAVWECFIESRDIRDTNSVSCGGRYTAIIGQIKWLPAEVYYTIERGEESRDAFESYIPWIEEKLNVHVHEAASSAEANLFLHFGGELPAGCHGAYGCNTWTDSIDKIYADIWVTTDDQFFGQVLKHEILHALLPMGHLPPGDHLMSMANDVQELSELEEKLLAIYTYPYLTDGIEMEKFINYLILE